MRGDRRRRSKSVAVRGIGMAMNRPPLLSCLLLLISALVVAPARAAEPSTGDRIPILAWGSPPAEFERYQEFADAGFTHTVAGASNAEEMRKVLDIAEKVGVLLVANFEALRTDTANAVNAIKDHPALGGYYLRDEPSAELFKELADWAKRVQAADNEHPVYINLFPNYATPEQLGTPDYQTHLDRFAAEVPVPFISFDHYPVIKEADKPEFLRPEYYDNLERIARKAKEVNKPFWAFTLSVAHSPYPIATLTHMRLQVFSDLAYGAQGIQYFTYWTPISDVWNFHEAAITPEGKRTPVYDRIKQLNTEIRGLSRVFKGATVVSLGHTGEKLPHGTKQYEAAAPVAAVETEGEGAVVSLLNNGGRQYLAIVNRDLHNPMPLTVKLDGSKKVESVDKQGATHPVTTPVFQANVEPGDIAVLGWARE